MANLVFDTSKLEPVPEIRGGGMADATAIAAYSQAVSLKRIADALDALNDRNEYGERPFEAIGAGIARALRGR